MGLLKKDGKIGRDVAAQEVDAWCDAWKMGRKISRLKGESLELAEEQKETLIDLIKDGNLVFNREKNTVTYHLIDEVEEFSNGIEFGRPNGTAIMESDRFKENESVKRAYATIAGVIGESMKRVHKLEYNTDVANLMTIIGFFLTT